MTSESSFTFESSVTSAKMESSTVIFPSFKERFFVVAQSALRGVKEDTAETLTTNLFVAVITADFKRPLRGRAKFVAKLVEF